MTPEEKVKDLEELLEKGEVIHNIEPILECCHSGKYCDREKDWLGRAFCGWLGDTTNPQPCPYVRVGYETFRDKDNSTFQRRGCNLYDDLEEI